MEEQAEYKTGIQDAMEMLGAGYEQPAIEIAPAHTVLERRGKEFQEVEKPAFVKISTGFKAEMKSIDEVALKVWLYISLCVNRYSGRANPGLRTIATECSLAVNTVRSAIERLEGEYNLLTVDRESKRYNIYEPLAFVSANRTDPGVSANDTPGETVSIEDKTVSIEGQSVSARVILNQRNQKNKNKKGDLVDGLLHFSKEAKKQDKGNVQDCQDRAERELRRLQFNLLGTRGPDRDRFIRFLQAEEKKFGRTIEAWVEWCFRDGFWPGKISSVHKVMELWLKAFELPQELSYDEQLAKAGYK